MHWLGWMIIVFLFLLVWLGRPMSFPVKRKTLSNEVERLTRDEEM